MESSRDIQRHTKKAKLCSICHKRPALARTKKHVKRVSLKYHDTCEQCWRRLTELGGLHG